MAEKTLRIMLPVWVLRRSIVLRTLLPDVFRVLRGCSAG